MLKLIDRAVVAYYNKRSQEHKEVITGDDLAIKADEFAEDTLKKISGRYGGNAHFQTRESAKTFFKKHFYDAVRGEYNVIEPARKTPVVIDLDISPIASVKNGDLRPIVTAAELDHHATVIAIRFLQRRPAERISYFYFENDDSIETSFKNNFYNAVREHYDVTEVVEENPLRAPFPN